MASSMYSIILVVAVAISVRPVALFLFHDLAKEMKATPGVLIAMDRTWLEVIVILIVAVVVRAMIIIVVVVPFSLVVVFVVVVVMMTSLWFHCLEPVVIRGEFGEVGEAQIGLHH
eukprot:3928824-Ditylum_brightwellii.AAC.1